MAAIRSTSGQRRRSTIVVAMVALVLMVTMAGRVPVGVGGSAIRSDASAAPESSHAVVTNSNTGATHTTRWTRQSPESVPTLLTSGAVVREKRTLLKLKPLVVLPAKVALGAGAKLVAGAKLGVKAVGLGAKALGVGAIGLKAVKKVAKVTVKAATALGIKAVLINFLFQKINQVIDFKTRLLSNLDQRNRQQNAQFLSPALPQSSSAAKSTGSVGNKDDAAAAAVANFDPVPPQGFAVAADAPGFVTVSPPLGFAPGSDLIASPPPDFSAAPPSSFGAVLPPGTGAAGPPLLAFEADPSSNLRIASQQGYGGAAPLGFSATNDDGSPSSETSF